MTTYHVKNTLDFIEGLNLAGPDSFTAIAIESEPPPDKEKSASIDAGSTVSFISNLSSQAKEDVLNGTLLAQLSANATYNRETDTQNWYTFYLQVLENIGWVMESMNFQHYSANSKKLTLDSVVIETLVSIASGDELGVLQDAFSAFSGLSADSGQVKLFDSNATGGNNGNFQVGSASQDQNGNVSMTLGSYYYTAKEQHNRFLFYTWSSDEVDLYYDAHRVVLNEEVYASVRKAIIDKLGDKAKTFVASLKI